MLDFCDKTMWASMLSFFLAWFHSPIPFFHLFVKRSYAWSYRRYFALALAQNISVLFIFLTKVEVQWYFQRLLERLLDLLFRLFPAISHYIGRKCLFYVLMVTVRNISFILSHVSPAFDFQLLTLHQIILHLGSLDLVVTSEEVFGNVETCLRCWT